MLPEDMCHYIKISVSDKEGLHTSYWSRMPHRRLRSQWQLREEEPLFFVDVVISRFFIP